MLGNENTTAGKEKPKKQKTKNSEGDGHGMRSQRRIKRFLKKALIIPSLSEGARELCFPLNEESKELLSVNQTSWVSCIKYRTIIIS